MTNPRPNPALPWRPLREKDAKGRWRWNEAMRLDTDGKHGVYAIRDASTHEVLYVGESHTARLWATMTRHFQDRTGSFKALREVTFTSTHPERFEAAHWTTKTGTAAQRLQHVKIRTLRPRHNQVDGKGRRLDDEELPEWVTSNPSPPRKNPGEPKHFYRSVLVPSASIERAREGYREASTPTARAIADGYLRVLAGGAPVRWTGARELEPAYLRGVRSGIRTIERWDWFAALHDTIEIGDDSFALIARHGGKRNPGRRASGGAAARAEYEKTHWGERGPRASRRLRVPDVSPTIPLVELGELVAVTYRTRKGGDVRVVNYVHDFKASDRPVLAYSSDGKGLYIAGGSYRVTERGIEG